MDTISVVNWDRFQHYHKDNPTWIKLYRSTLDSYEFSSILTDAQRYHLIGVWLLAARHDNKIPADPSYIARCISSTEKVDIQPLIDTGFITLSIDPIEDVYRTSIPETETETEKKPPNPLEGGTEKVDLPVSAKPEKPKRKRRDSELTPQQLSAFRAWWTVWPNKEGIGAAEKAWAERNPDATLTAVMIAAVEAQKKRRAAKKERGEFVPPWKNPSTWLNQRCEENEPLDERPPPKKYATCYVVADEDESLYSELRDGETVWHYNIGITNARKRDLNLTIGSRVKLLITEANELLRRGPDDAGPSLRKG